MYVLDTNILVAALWSRSGASHALMRMAVAGDLPFAVSVALALEYETVLNRNEMRDASWASSAELEAILDALLAAAKLVMPIRYPMRPLLRDPSDDMVLECALQGGAVAIVTMNRRDFLPESERFGLEILKPGELLARIRAGEGQ